MTGTEILIGLGEASIHALWLPLLAWTVLWVMAEIGMRIVSNVHPLIRYRASQALLLSLPLALVSASALDLSILVPAPPPIILESSPALLLDGTFAAETLSGVADAALASSIPIVPLTAGIGILLAMMLSLFATMRLIMQVFRFEVFRGKISVSSLPLDVSDLLRGDRWPANVRFVDCSLDVVPMTYGLLRPTIVVPSTLSDHEKRLAIEHELIHVWHFDFAGRLAELATRAILFFHPATTVLARRCELLREMTCDAMLTGRDIDVSAYAKLLYRFAAPPARPVAVTVSMADSPSHITRRLGAMNAAAYSSKKPYALAFTLACTVLTLVSLGAAAPFAIAQTSPEVIIQDRGQAALESHLFRFTIDVTGDDVYSNPNTAQPGKT
jgi:beta-lactamase regulating signal transducer with metallopeptidase domain